MSNPKVTAKFRLHQAAEFAARARRVSLWLSIPLQKAQELLAQTYGFNDLHELQSDRKLALADPALLPEGPFHNRLHGETEEDFDLMEVQYERLLGLAVSAAATDAIDRARHVGSLGLFCERAEHEAMWERAQAMMDEESPGARLEGRKLRNHAGMLLIGDEESLRALYALIHRVSDEVAFLADDDGFLGLAYDVRKAFQGARRRLRRDSAQSESTPRFGVEILWPVLLFQARQLRVALAGARSSPSEIALVSALEAAVEVTIESDLGAAGREALAAASQLPVEMLEAAGEPLGSRGGLFCSWTPGERKAGLAELMASFHPAYYSSPKSGQLSASSIARWRDREWPEVDW